MKRIVRYMALMTALAAVFSSCHHKEEKVEPEKVMILYSAGYNSLSSYLAEDIEDLSYGYIPQKNDKNILVVVSHQTASKGDYSTKTPPCLFRIYKQKEAVVMDTLMTKTAGTSALDADVMRSFLSFVQTTWPAKSYGMVFSSHGSGWLPENYYTVGETKGAKASPRGVSGTGPLHAEPPHDSAFPLTKAIGPENITAAGSRYDTEIGIEQFASAIPMHLDYLLFDACFMGCVETAYSLRSVTDLVGFSPAEVLADGFDYTKITSQLLLGATPDPTAVCDAYYQQYAVRTGYNKAAAISLVRTSALPQLASVCSSLFEKYRDGISALGAGDVQPFFGGTKHWFYDLEDILIQAGASSSDISTLESALSQCVVYKNHTGQYVSAIDGLHAINIYSGFAMYMPSVGTEYLDSYYRSLSWNAATGLVK